MRIVLFFIVLISASSFSLGAELTTFLAGEPIEASSINGNFSELEARINALEALIDASGGLPGEPVNLGIGAGGNLALQAGFTYYITDIVFGLGVASAGSCGFTGGIKAGELSGDTLGLIVRIPPSGGGGTCTATGRHMSLQTPIAIPAEETLTWAAPAHVRLIGYRKAN
jgi:hypothetical protein